MARSKSNRLFVEGKRDLWVLPYLMEKQGIVWNRGEEPVDINALGAKSLPRADASAILKDSNLRNLGVMLDADESAIATWQLVRTWFGEWFHDMPDQIKPDGYLSASKVNGGRLGVWIMPDNQERGMMETFLKFLVRPGDQALLSFAASARDEAKSKYQAPFKPAHLDKALIHTFLAWQDEPGRQLHEAVDHAVLDPSSPYCHGFVTWFCTLFEV